MLDCALETQGFIFYKDTLRSHRACLVVVVVLVVVLVVFDLGFTECEYYKRNRKQRGTQAPEDLHGSVEKGVTPRIIASIDKT